VEAEEEEEVTEGEISSEDTPVTEGEISSEEYFCPRKVF